ncbi:MAG: amidohydrolase family protein [Fidelibacterota bacterium]
MLNLFLIVLISLGQAQITNSSCCTLPQGTDSETSAVPDQTEKRTKSWDITAPFGPIQPFMTDVTEGTWMSCDLSPDGSTIIFDLLGNIYRMAVSGGQAEALTSGPAWDIQPSFSPDGQTIVYTSDRSGGDNIWTMDLQGNNPTQITDESFRLLNNPVYTPDGKHIVARKHFVKSRSLGAGEMWLYLASGKGKGYSLTKKRDWQHDAGEPELSPDGNYLYYSQDVSPGKTFQYNRDPYQTIYAINRYDLNTGETVRITGGPGGAATPQISPNGEYLAFVKRIGLKTVLMVRDLATGTEEMVFDKLNRDAQETWAIFGVHPGFSWYPDNRRILITARGHFWTVDTRTKAASEIPFTAHIEQTLTQPITFSHATWTPEFPVKALRNLRVSPNGDLVVFQALGSLWVAGIDGSDRKRLTDPAEGVGLVPTWSPDGKKIAFSFWSDKNSGSIRIISARGKRERTVDLPPGHFGDLAWSPNGKYLLYRRQGGHWSRGFEHSTEPGLYLLALEKGAQPLLIAQSARKPRFNGKGDRILYLDREDENTVLVSVDLRGFDRHVLATSRYGDNIVLSPDENWIAFHERYQHYVAPYYPTGKAVELSPSMSAVPAFRLTADSGFNLQWSRDSKTLYWTLGPNLFQRPVSDCFTFATGAPDSLPPLDSAGVNLSWLENADQPSGLLALTGVRIITMDHDLVIEDGTIIIRDNRIVALGPVDSVTVPSSAIIISLPGKTIIPGLVDVHAHMGVNWDGIQSQQRWQYLANLAFGVTTTHDPSNDTELIFANSERQKAGLILAPRIFSTGTILYGAQTSFTAEINSLAEARSHIKRIKAFGGFSVKSYNQPRREQRQQVLKAARQLHMLVFPEGGSTFQHNMNMIVDGHTGIEHSIPVSPLYDDVIKLFAASGVSYTPTLIVSYGGLWGENYWYQHQKVFEHEHLQQFMPQVLLDQKRRRMMVEDNDYNFIDNARAAKALAGAGVKVNNGAHGQLQGLGAHWEMWMMVQGGMTPMEALTASTLNGAAYIGMEQDIGSLAPGKLADLVILDKNPLEDIRNSDSVSMVMLNGRLYDAMTLTQKFPEKSNSPYRWWMQR